MSNPSPASSPEFKRILEDLYASGKYKRSDEVLREAWRIWRKDYGPESSLEQKRRYAYRKTFENPKVKFRERIRIDTQEQADAWAQELNDFLLGKPTPRIKNKRQANMVAEALDKWIAKHYPTKYPSNPRKKSYRFTDYAYEREKIKDRYSISKIDAWSGERKFFLTTKSLAQAKRIVQGLLNREPESKPEITDFVTGKIYKFNPIKRWQHPVSEQQRRWAFAAEARGELPRGTAIKWSRRVKRKRAKNPIAVYNPQIRVVKTFPAVNIEMRYKRHGGYYDGEKFRHPFKGDVKVQCLSDGSLRLVSLNGNKLWGTVD